MKKSLTKLDKLKIQIAVIEQLRVLKKFCKYRELEEDLGIPASILARYIKGEMIPSYERAIEIMRKIYEKRLLERVLKNILILDRHGFLNIREALSDSGIMKLIAYRILFEEISFNKVVCMDIDSIPISSLVSSVTETSLVLISKEKIIGSERLVEETIRIDNPPFIITLYVPESALKEDDYVIIIGSVLRTGRTLKALWRLLSRLKVEVIRIFIIASIGNLWEERLKEIKEKISVFVRY